MTVQFEKALESDCELIIELNNKAYHSDFIRYGECPGYNVPVEQMRTSLLESETQKFIVYANQLPIGVISVKKIAEQSYFLGNLCIIPEYQSKGYGKQAIDFVLSHFTDLKELSLVTPADKVENIYFYTKKCGFLVTGTIQEGNVTLADIIYKKA